MKITQFPIWCNNNHVRDNKAYSFLNFSIFHNLIRQIYLQDPYLQIYATDFLLLPWWPTLKPFNHIFAQVMWSIWVWMSPILNSPNTTHRVPWHGNPKPEKGILVCDLIFCFFYLARYLRHGVSSSIWYVG